MSRSKARKNVTRITGVALIAASVSGVSLATAQAAAPANPAPACVATMAPTDGAPAMAAEQLERTVRGIDGANSQILLDGKLVKVNENKSSWTTKNAIPVLRPHAQEQIYIAGSDSDGKKVSFELLFNKTDVGPQLKVVKINGQTDDAQVRAQTVKFSQLSDTTDFAQVNLLTDDAHTVQFNLLGVR